LRREVNDALHWSPLWPAWWDRLRPSVPQRVSADHGLFPCRRSPCRAPVSMPASLSGTVGISARTTPYRDHRRVRESLHWSDVDKISSGERDTGLSNVVQEANADVAPARMALFPTRLDGTGSCCGGVTTTCTDDMHPWATGSFDHARRVPRNWWERVSRHRRVRRPPRPGPARHGHPRLRPDGRDRPAMLDVETPEQRQAAAPGSALQCAVTGCPARSREAGGGGGASAPRWAPSGSRAAVAVQACRGGRPLRDRQHGLARWVAVAAMVVICVAGDAGRVGGAGGVRTAPGMPEVEAPFRALQPPQPGRVGGDRPVVTHVAAAPGHLRSPTTRPVGRVAICAGPSTGTRRRAGVTDQRSMFSHPTRSIAAAGLHERLAARSVT
jgi:hypothetical protein